MARDVAGLAPGSEVPWIPESLDNRNDPDGTPVKFVFRAPSQGERRELSHDPENPVRVEIDDDGKPKVTRLPALQKAWRDKLITRFLIRVENYKRSGIPVTNGADLVRIGEDEFYEEAYYGIVNLLTLSPEAAKLFAGPSDSSPQAIRPSSGNAASAEAQDSTKSATADPPKRIHDSDTPASAQA